MVEMAENFINSTNGIEKQENGIDVITDSHINEENNTASTSSTTNDDSNNYDTVFPSLPTGNGSFNVSDVWNSNAKDSRLSIKRHTTTQVFHVPVEERRYKDVATFGNETNKKCQDIANKYGVKVEIYCSKDQSLHIIISGQEDRILDAKRSIVNELQTERDHKIKVPKEQHKYLIGKMGSVLKELQEKTFSTIQVPKPDANSDLITITGPKEGIEQAIHEIQLICDEQSKTGFERLNIPKLYHPWIRGVNNEVMNEITSRTGAKINIPPPQIEKDEIAVSGEREKCEIACMDIKRIYNRLSKMSINKLAIQIPKSQHRLIIGKNGSTVQDIFRDFDVYVQVPKSDSTSETIYLFGEDAKLGAALSQVCSKANSMISCKIDADCWLHRHMIGEKGSNISKITADFPNTHVKFETDNTILIDGPPDEVEKVKERLLNITLSLKKSMSCEEIPFNNKYAQQVIGKKYENISRLNKDFGVVTRLLPDNTTANMIRIEGAPENVKKAKAEFLEMIKRFENERSKDIIIDQKFHSNLIGKNGKNLNEIRAKFNDIQINIPSVEEKSEVVTIRGNKVDVEKCFTHLQKVIKEMQENNYQEEIHIFKEFHRIIIGKNGAFIRKIRDDTQTRIEVPAEDSDSDSIVIVGKQENVMRARKQIEEKVKELIKIEEDSVEVPNSIHAALIGKGGAIIKQIRKDCGGVIINFPEQKNSDKITLRGPRAEIEKAKEELTKLAKEKNDLSYSEDIVAKLEYHRFLVGRNGNNINALKEKFNVRIIFPSSSSSNSSSSHVNGNAKDNNNNKSPNAQQVSPSDIITIIGKEENVKAAKVELEAKIKALEEQTSDEVTVDSKWHKNFTAKRGKLINKISDENCNVKISFPKASSGSNTVSLKGPKEAVDAAKKKLLEAVYEMENQVTIEVPVPQKYHVIIIGKKGIQSQQLSETYHVDIQFPAKSQDSPQSGTNGNSEMNGGSPEDSPNKSSSSSGTSSSCDMIQVSGLLEDCEKAKEAILSLLPVTEEVDFPSTFHKDLLADKAKILRDLSSDFNVQVNVPKKGDDSNHVTIIGSKENIASAKEALNEKLVEIELNNFKVELVDIKPELIPQLRGRNGNESSKLEKKFQVRIEFSRKGEPDRIVIKGLQSKVQECEAYIKKKIEDEESKISREIEIDNRVHSRIIGSQGKALLKITDKYKVDVKFAGRDNDLVTVRGDDSDNVDDACDHLKNLEEEYLQDVTERDAYRHPSAVKEENHSQSNGKSNGFVVKGAPWAAPDTSNMEDFPTIPTALTGPGAAQKMSWGPQRK